MAKRLLKVCGWLVGVLVLALLSLVIAYMAWLPSHEQALRDGSHIASTKLGDIEYAIAGEGTPVLRIHGSPGGYDHSIASARARPQDSAGFKIIAVSRPGYLRTPLDSGRTPAQQADLYAALLDELGIERTFVWGVSGGGPSGLHFAARHPQRTMGLVLVVPMLESTREYRNSMTASSKTTGVLQDFAYWMGTQLMSKPVAAATMPRAMPGFNADDPLQMALVQDIGRGFIPWRLRAPGRHNDLLQYRDLGIESLPLEGINVPTLIIHGTADASAPYSGSAAVARRLPNAELVTIDGGTHYIIVTQAREIAARTMTFLRELAHEEL